MQGIDVWIAARNALEEGRNACLVTMVNAEGSGPNRPGCRMLVTSVGARVGTVGGGGSEFALAEMAAAALSADACPVPQLVTMNHRPDAAADSSGMICSGSQRFVLVCLSVTDLQTVIAIIESFRRGLPRVIALDPEGLHCGPADTMPEGPEFDPDAWRYTEPIGMRDTATLVGGGHVSLALAPLLVSVGMRVVVLDNRPDLATMADNTFADERRVVDFADVIPHVQEGDRSYVAIMTFGHRHDELVLEQLVARRLRYLGMMGSAAKVAALRERLLARGISREALDAVHAPIGLPIGSNTPAEIAVSIAAQIIAVRNSDVD